METIGTILGFFPVCDAAPEGYEEYLRDAQDALCLCQAEQALWQTTPRVIYTTPHKQLCFPVLLAKTF